MTNDSPAPHWALGERLRLRDIYRNALRTFRERFVLVTVAALAVFGPLAVVEAFGEAWADNYEAGLTGRALLVSAMLLLIRSSALLLGGTFYAGLLDRVVGAHQHGHEYRSVWHVLRTLPYRQLIAADLLVSVAVLAGLGLFVLPGIILFTLFSLVGPIINIEHPGLRRAFERSAGLVRRNLRLSLLAVTAPVLAEELAHHGLEHLVIGNGSIVSEALPGVLFSASVGALVGLVEVTLAHALVARELALEAAPSG